MVIAKKFILVKDFVGLPKASDFKLEQEELPPLKENDYLVEAVYLSVDPYMRGCLAFVPKNLSTNGMVGSQVAKIIQSKNKDFPVGKYVVGYFGWRTHTLVTENSGPYFTDSTPVLLPDLQELPLSLGLGVLGMPGNTAYFGILEICKPKAGDIIVISGAAGAVGSHAGQIAKIKGCKVIGIAGSDEKGKVLIEEFGFDNFINYKTQNISEELEKIAPDGVDAYFDNVGGEITTAVISQMKHFGKIAICGLISGYNETEVPKISTPLPSVLYKELRVEGFVTPRWRDRWNEGTNQNLEWIKQGKLKYKETVTEGFENMFTAFIDMLQGKNIGKAIVKV